MKRESRKQASIDEMLQSAAKPSLTKDEFRAQRVSFALGMKSEGGKMTRKDIKKLADQRY